MVRWMLALSICASAVVQARPPRPAAPAAAASVPDDGASAPGHRAAAHEPAASAPAGPSFKRAHKEVIDRPNRGGR